MRILLGVTSMGQQEAKMFVDVANQHGADIRSYETKFSKLGIEQYLETHPDTDAVIVSEWLENKSVYDVSDFEKMVEMNENMRIIPIFGENVIGSDKIKGVFNLGIYTALFAKDASAEQVARMLVDGRSRKAAKAYYSIPDSEGAQFGANIQQCVTFICEDGLKDGILDRVQYVKEHVELADYQVILSRLPDDVKTIIRDAGENLIGVTLKDVPDSKNTEEPSKGELPVTAAPKAIAGGARKLFQMSHSMFRNPLKQKAEKEELEGTLEESIQDKKDGDTVSSEQLKEILINMTVAFVGTQRRIGCTHQAILAAHYLRNCGYRVALADCTNTKGKTFDAIARYMSVDAKKGFFTYNGVDYYSNIESSMSEIFRAKEKYNFIVIDFGTFDRADRELFNKANVKCVVAGVMPWEIGASNSFAMEAKTVLAECNVVVRGTLFGGEMQDIFPGANVMSGEIQMNPFSGECYESLRSAFDAYTFSGRTLTEKNRSTGKKKSLFAASSETAASRSEKVRKIGTASVYVTSLKRGCGNSHFAAAVSNYLSRKGQEVCLISDAAGIEDLVDDQILIKNTSQMKDDAFAENDYLIFDDGVYTDLSGDQLAQCRRSDYKIMMCWADEDYMKKLAEFVSKQKDNAENWIFMFNNVPTRKISEVKKVMNLYFSCFLPLFEAEDPDRDTKRILKEVFG